MVTLRLLMQATRQMVFSFMEMKEMRGGTGLVEEVKVLSWMC